MDITALRDHADEMLTVIVVDLASTQTPFEQSEKSKGRAQPWDSPAWTAAEAHGIDRAEDGFTITQMVAEYRALRASVIRLWTEAAGELTTEHTQDLIRFNEAIDQALAESVSRFDQAVKHAREMFLAILGHDLRTPLNAISLSANALLTFEDLEAERRTRLAAGISNSAQRMAQMVGDLLDFTRSRLGGGMPVVRAEMSMTQGLHAVVEEIASAHPTCTLHIDSPEEQRGEWDEARMGQALSNVIDNAVKHAAEGTPVTVTLRGTRDQVTIVVHNDGAPIPPDELDGIFNPMKVRGSLQNERERGPTASLGLGLYIAERIVSAHDGHIEVESSAASGTTFTLYLPRREKRDAR